MPKRRLSNPQIDKEIDKLFADADRNNDGVISRTEFDSLIERLFPQLHFSTQSEKKEQIDELFNKIDKDGNQFVDADEIRQFIKEQIMDILGPDQPIDSLESPLKRADTGRETVEAIRLIIEGFRNAFNEMRHLNTSSMTENEFENSKKDLLCNLNRNHEYDHLSTWESSNQQEYWCRFGTITDGERNTCIQYYFQAKSFFLNLPETYLSNQLADDVYIEHEKCAIKHLRNLLIMNEKLVMERDRELFYQDFLKEFYVGGGYNSFITSTINRFIPYLFSNDNILRTRYKNDTTEIVNYIFEIAIYFWMTPKVSDRTPITSVKRQIQQILKQSLQKGSFIFDLLSAAGQVNNDPENESQLLYWKLIAVILEMDTYNDLLNDRYFIEILFMLKSPVFDKIITNFVRPYISRNDKKRLYLQKNKVLATQTFVFAKCASFLQDGNRNQSQIFLKNQNLVNGLILDCLEIMNETTKEESDVFENLAICVINTLKVSLLFAKKNLYHEHLSPNSVTEILKSIIIIFKRLSEKEKLFMFEFVFELIAITSAPYDKGVEDCIIWALGYNPNLLEYGKGSMIKQAYQIIKSNGDKIHESFVPFIVEHIRCEIKGVRNEARMVLMQRSDLMQYVPKLGRLLFPFTRFDIESLAGYGEKQIKRSEPFRYCFSEIKMVLELLIKAFHEKTDPKIHQTATVAVLPHLKYFCLLLRDEIRNHTHNAAIKDEFFADEKNENNMLKKEQKSILELLEHLFKQVDQNMIDETISEGFRYLQHEIKDILSTKIIPRVAPPLVTDRAEEFYYPKAPSSTNRRFLGRVLRPEITVNKSIVKVEDMPMKFDPSNPKIYHPLPSCIDELKIAFSNPLLHYIDPFSYNREGYFIDLKVNGQSYRYTPNTTGVKYPFKVNENKSILFLGRDYGTQTNCIPAQDSQISLSFWAKTSTSYFDNSLYPTNEGPVGSGRSFTQVTISLHSTMFRDTIIEVDFQVNSLIQIKRKIQDIYKIHSQGFILFAGTKNTPSAQWIPLVDEQSLREFYSMYTATNSSYMFIENDTFCFKVVSSGDTSLAFESWQVLERELRNTFTLQDTTTEFLGRIYEMRQRNIDYSYGDLKKFLKEKMNYFIPENDWRTFQKLTRGSAESGIFKKNSKHVLYGLICFLKPEFGEKATKDRKIEFFKLLCQDKIERSRYLKDSVENLYYDIDLDSSVFERREKLKNLPKKMDEHHFNQFLDIPEISNFLNQYWHRNPKKDGQDRRDGQDKRDGQDRRDGQDKRDGKGNRDQMQIKKKEPSAHEKTKEIENKYGVKANRNTKCNYCNKNGHFSALCFGYWRDHNDAAVRNVNKIIGQNKNNTNKMTNALMKKPPQP